MMTAQGQPMEHRDYPTPELGAGEALVAVAGCGVCHTDISFLHMGVKTRAELPLVLGHEISGTVVATGEGVDANWVGKPVVVPAVLPCGTCPACQAGERRICPQQIMPGNDRHGGFATHVAVPARYLCAVPDAVLARYELWELSVVADAVTTPFQAIRRAGLTEGELAIVVGAGGIGIHGVQIAAATGATVIALDIDPGKLEVAATHGARATIDVRDLDGKEIKAKVKEAAKQLGAPRFGHKIFEMSGTKPGQATAFGLLGFGGTVSVVGFTMDKLEVRLSNLMAFDARMLGNWGCDPELYPEVLEWLGAGRIQLGPFVERHPLPEINDVFDAAHHGKLERRGVMVP
jgi:6-hydroxycyclohex-1-ene-1-carbonyl-CoA dehydrogenase